MWEPLDLSAIGNPDIMRFEPSRFADLYLSYIDI